MATEKSTSPDPTFASRELHELIELLIDQADDQQFADDAAKLQFRIRGLGSRMLQLSAELMQAVCDGQDLRQARQEGTSAKPDLGEAAALPDALKRASAALYDSHRGARSLLSMLEAMGFADAMDDAKLPKGAYEMVHAVESMLRKMRDDALEAVQACDKAGHIAEEVSHG